MQWAGFRRSNCQQRANQEVMREDAIAQRIEGRKDKSENEGRYVPLSSRKQR